MANPTLLAISVSQEELLLILNYMKAKNLAGFEQTVFKRLSEKQLNLVLGVAERSLIARNFIKPRKDGQLILEPPIFAVIGACAFPEKSLLVTHSIPNISQENYYFHISRKMIVLHTVPMTGIHQFIAVEERSAIAKTVLSILDLDSGISSSDLSGTIDQATLVKAQDTAIKKGREAAFELLHKSSLNVETAQEFANTLAEPKSNTTIAYVEQEGNFTDGFSVLQSGRSIWLLSIGEMKSSHKENLVKISNVSSADVQKNVKVLLKL